MTASRIAFLSIALVLVTDTASAQYTAAEVPIGPGDSEITLQLFLFHSHQTAVRIIPRSAQGGGTISNLGEAMLRYECAAGCNGGPTNSQGQPLGLVVSDQRRTGEPVLDSIWTEGVLSLEESQPSLERSDKFFAARSNNLPPLLQAGPFLVENGTPASALDSQSMLRRTFIVTDGGHQWAIGYSPATTLAKLARALANPDTFADFNVKTALNLGGGTASGIWVKQQYGPFYLKEVRGVDHFLGLIPRTKD